MSTSHFFDKKLIKSLQITKKPLSLQSLSEMRGKNKKRCGSSAWLECRPVTPEVAGSSPVRTAEKQG